MPYKIRCKQNIKHEGKWYKPNEEFEVKQIPKGIDKRIANIEEIPEAVEVEAIEVKTETAKKKVTKKTVKKAE